MEIIVPTWSVTLRAPYDHELTVVVKTGVESVERAIAAARDAIMRFIMKTLEQQRADWSFRMDDWVVIKVERLS